MTHILAYMDALAPTGFGTVSDNIFKRILPFLEANDIHIDVLSRNLGDRDEVEINKNIKVYHPRIFQEKNVKDPNYRNGLLVRLTQKPYKLLWIMDDVKVIEPILEVFYNIRAKKAAIGQSFKIVFYTPIDGILPSNLFKNFKGINEIITYTEYGQKIIAKNLELNGISKHISVIPHGIDTENFRPLKEDFRNKYKLPTDVFMFGNINKNQPRKDIGSTLLAFAKFKSTYMGEMKVGLYLHCHPLDPSGINIYEVAQNLGLELNKDYFLPIMDKYEKGDYTESEMNEVYNCLDCFIGTSMAEGWGLTYTQAIAVGLPVIYGKHTSLEEIFENFLEAYATSCNSEHIQINDGNAIRYKLDLNDIVMHMTEVYQYFIGCFMSEEDIPHQNNYLDLKYDLKFENIKNNAILIQKKYNWDTIARQWEYVLGANLNTTILVNLDKENVRYNSSSTNLNP